MYLLFFILFYSCHSPNQFPNSPVVFLFNFLFHSFSLLPLLSTSLPPLRLCPPTFPSFPFFLPLTTFPPSPPLSFLASSSTSVHPPLPFSSQHPAATSLNPPLM